MKSQSEAETHQWHHQTLFDLCLTYLLQKTILSKTLAGLQGNTPRKGVATMPSAVKADQGLFITFKSKHGAKLSVITIFKYCECQTYVKQAFLSLFFNKQYFEHCQSDDSQNKSEGSEGKCLSYTPVI